MRTLLLLIFCLGLTVSASAQKSATTADGKKVLLYDNGTWKYADAPKAAAKPATKPAPAPKPAAAKTASKTAAKPAPAAAGPKLPKRCKVVTKGKQCTRTTLFANGKCWQHGGN